MIEMVASNGIKFLVDDSDYDLIKKYKWQTLKNKKTGAHYIRTRIGQKTILLHRMLLSPPAGYVVDHINGVTTDNRRSNLRVATHSQNNMNSKVKSRKYKGIKWKPDERKWQTRITFKGKEVSLGQYPCPIVAAIRYDIEAKKLFGEYARINFPSSRGN
jgi:hypothetical protein